MSPSLPKDQDLSAHLLVVIAGVAHLTMLFVVAVGGVCVPCTWLWDSIQFGCSAWGLLTYMFAGRCTPGHSALTPVFEVLANTWLGPEDMHSRAAGTAFGTCGYSWRIKLRASSLQGRWLFSHWATLHPKPQYLMLITGLSAEYFQGLKIIRTLEEYQDSF